MKNNRIEETITLQDVIDIHDEVIKGSGGINGLSRDKSLEFALFRIDHRIHYEGLEDVYEIAAWYCFAIARGHTFIDGNKRTAFICMTSYLSAYSIELEFNESDEELANFMENLANGEVAIESLVIWLKRQSKS